MDNLLQIFIVFTLLFIVGFSTGWCMRKILKEVIMIVKFNTNGKEIKTFSFSPNGKNWEESYAYPTQRNN